MNFNEKKFEEYLLYYNNLTSSEKEKIIIEQLKLLTSFSSDMCKSLNFKNDKFININNKTQGDFFEETIIYINLIQDSLANFNLELKNFLSEILKNEE